MTSLITLPKDVLFLIAALLPFNEVHRFGAINRRLRKLYSMPEFSQLIARTYLTTTQWQKYNKRKLIRIRQEIGKFKKIHNIHEEYLTQWSNREQDEILPLIAFPSHSPIYYLIKNGCTLYFKTVTMTRLYAFQLACLAITNFNEELLHYLWHKYNLSGSLIEWHQTRPLDQYQCTKFLARQLPSLMEINQDELINRLPYVGYLI